MRFRLEASAGPTAAEEAETGARTRARAGAETKAAAAAGAAGAHIMAEALRR